MLLSFERPAAGRPLCREPFCGPRVVRPLSPAVRPSPDLENCTVGQRVRESMSPRTHLGITELSRERPQLSVAGTRKSSDHRQDIKGTRWMPWHQESKKGVDDCDKPR
jgi:hypothetical protein